MKPRIYSFCDAGCKWETVHKADFDRSASIVRETPDENGNYTLDPFKVYKVNTASTDGAYNATFSLQDGVDYSFTYDEFDEYRDYIIFEILSVTLDDTATEVTIVYEINGNRYSDAITASTLDLTTLKLYISGAVDVFMFNSNAEILADSQQIYETSSLFLGGTCPDTLPTDELSTNPAPMYDGQREAKVGDLLLYKYGTANAKGQDTILCKITRTTRKKNVYMQAVCFVQGAGNGDGGGGITLVKETFTISSWTADATLDPFAYKADITASATIGDNTILSLDIDTRTATANGIAIGAVNGQVVSIYAISAPAESITIKLIIQK